MDELTLQNQIEIILFNDYSYPNKKYLEKLFNLCYQKDYFSLCQKIYTSSYLETPFYYIYFNEAIQHHKLEYLSLFFTSMDIVLFSDYLNHYQQSSVFPFLIDILFERDESDIIFTINLFTQKNQSAYPLNKDKHNIYILLEILENRYQQTVLWKNIENPLDTTEKINRKI